MKQSINFKKMFRRVLQDQIILNKSGSTITGTTIGFTGRTITDSGNGFLTAGFEAGQSVVVTGSVSNNGTFVVTTAAAGVLTCSATDFVTEAAGATVTAATSRNGNVLNVTDFRDIVLCIVSDNSATATVKIQGAIARYNSSNAQYGAPTFSSAASSTNPWVNLQSVDLSNGNAISGATGISYAGTDSVYLVEVNVNAVDFITATVSSRSAGNITVFATSATNL